MKNNNHLTTAFNDIVMNLAMILTVLFVIAMMLITIQKNAKNEIESKDNFLITMDWNNDSSYDVDLYIRNPEGEIIYFHKKDSSWATLERDDLGFKNDTMIVNGEPIIFRINREVLHLRNLVEGEYTVNVHVFSGEVSGNNAIPENISIEFVQVQPSYSILYKHSLNIQLPVKGEITAFSFTYNGSDKLILIDDITQYEYCNKILGSNPGPGP